MAIKQRFIAGVAALGLLSFNLEANNLYNELNFLQQNHPLIAASGAQRTAAEKNHLATKGSRVPIVSITAQGGYENQDRPNDLETSETIQTASVSVTQRILDFGATSGLVKAAAARIDVAGESLNQTKQDILQAGIQAYFGLVLAYERVEYAKESVQRIERQQNTEQAKIDQGSGSRADYLQAQSQLLSAESRLANEDGALQIAKARYIQIFGKNPPSYKALLKEAMPSKAIPTSLADAENLAISDLPSVKAAAANLKAANRELGASKGTYYPRFDIVAEGDYRENAQAVIGQVTESRLLLRMQYDFDLGFTNRGNVGVARANQVAANFEKANQERVALETVRSAWVRYQVAQKNYDISEQQLVSATEFLQLAIRERELGKRTLRDILNGELVRLNARTRLATARVDLTTSAFDILRATGQLNLDVI